MFNDAHEIASRDDLEKYKVRYSFYKIIFGTAIVGLASVLIPGAIEYWQLQSDERRKKLEIELTQITQQQEYVKDFLDTALNQDIELRIRFADYFSSVSAVEYKQDWQLFKESLMKVRKSARSEINEKEKQLLKSLANKSPSLDEQIEIAKLERELEWRYREVGYVEKNRSVVRSEDEKSNLHGTNPKDIELSTYNPFDLPTGISYDINISGGEHGALPNGGGALPGEYVSDYYYPDIATLEEKAELGFDRIRLNLRNERLQLCAFCDIDQKELERVSSVVRTARTLGMGVILDIHNYGMYYSKHIEPVQFADFWRKLAFEFSGDLGIWFGLNNEPHSIPIDIWKEAAQAAINSIRTVSSTQKILVSGTRWGNAHRHFESSPNSESNAEMFFSLTDPGPGNNLISEVHAYPDPDTDEAGHQNYAYAGDDDQCESATVLADNLGAWAEWLRTNRLKGYIGEYAVTDNEKCLATLSNFLRFLKRNDDVIVGSAIWAGGDRLGPEYRYLISKALGKGRAQLTVLAPYLKSQ